MFSVRFSIPLPEMAKQVNFILVFCIVEMVCANMTSNTNT